KLVEGRTLSARLKERASPADGLPELVRAFEQVCLAVGFAHDKGVIHRDLKPANVMIGAFGEVQVMDWGLAKAGDGNPSPGAPNPPPSPGGEKGTLDTDSATITGQVLGTPAYMSPEQARGEPVDPRTDVFSLGAILCEILTGSRPFTGQTSAEVISQTVAGDLGAALVKLDASGADGELVALAKRCLAPRAADRPANGKAVADAVTAYRAGAEARVRAAEAERAAAEARAAEQRKRRRVQLALAGAVTALLLGAGAVGWWADRQSTAHRAETERLAREQASADLQQREKDDRAADENRRALAEEVARCEAALRADDAPAAGVALIEIGRRENHPGAEGFRPRIARCRADQAMLARLDAAETFRWAPVNGAFPPFAALERKWVEAFAAYGADIASAPAAEAAARVSAALIRERLLFTLELWHANVNFPNLGAVLHAADPDPVRDAIRTAIRDRAFADVGERVRALHRAAERPEQPARFTIALSESAGDVLPARARRDLLAAEWARSPNNLRVVMALGRTYPMNQSDGAAERVRWFQSAVALRPDSAFTWSNLAVALIDSARYDEALVATRTALRLDPKNTDALTNTGVALRKKGDPAGAVAAYRAALAIDPHLAHPTFHNNFGAALGAAGDLGGAVGQFKKAIELDPKFAPAHANLGNALLRQRDPDGAVRSLREALKLDPQNAEAHETLGRALLQKRDRAGAIAALRESLRLDPKNVNLWGGLGNLLWDQGDREGAIGAFRAALRHAPDEAGLHHNLGLLLRQTGDAKGAISEYQEAIRLDPKHTRARYSLGIALKASGDAAGAVAAYRELLALDPSHAAGHNGLGNALWDLGDLDGAIGAFRAALQIDPNNGPARANLADALKERALRDRTAPPPRAVKRP
ncbi:MAG TPA: tetratricopeptide repeat protein, partial [Gemmata sp.]